MSRLSAVSLMRTCWLRYPMESIHVERRGEFHSFVYAGPMLTVDIPVSVGESVARDQFVFADLSPAAVCATPSSQ